MPNRVLPYSEYREFFNDQGLAAEGIFDPDTYTNACADSSALLVDTDRGKAPLAIPIELPNLFNRDYYLAKGVLAGTPLYWLTLPLHQLACIDSGEALQVLVDEGAVLAFDYAVPISADSANSTDAAQSSLGDQLKTMGFGGTVTHMPDVHYDYASILTCPAPELSTNVPALQALLENSPTEGNVRIEASLPDIDIEQVWDFYKPAHNQIEITDPARAGFTKEELTAILQNPSFAKSVYRVGGTIINIAMLTHPNNCEWINSAYFTKHFPDEYRADQVLFSPGIVTNQTAASVGKIAAASLATIGAFGKALARANITPAMGFTCNSVSNQSVPRLGERGFTRNGMTAIFPLRGVHRFGIVTPNQKASARALV